MWIVTLAKDRTLKPDLGHHFSHLYWPKVSDHGGLEPVTDTVTAWLMLLHQFTCQSRTPSFPRSRSRPQDTLTPPLKAAALPDPEGACHFFPSENHGLRIGSADSHSSCFTLGCKLPQNTPRSRNEGGNNSTSSMKSGVAIQWPLFRTPTGLRSNEHYISPDIPNSSEFLL